MPPKEEVQKNNNNGEGRAIKTYRDFAVSSLRGESTSLAKMIIKEKKKQEIKRSQVVVQKKNTFMVVMSVFLVLLGVAAIIGIFFFTINQDNTDNKRLSFDSFVLYNFHKGIDMTGMGHQDLVETFETLIADTQIPIGDVKIIYFTDQDKQGFERIAPARDFIIALDTRIPIQLERTLYKTFSAGIVSINTNLPFLIFKVHSFDTAYVKMREWERSILFDMGSLLGVDKRFYSQQFIDLNLFNEDARVILNEEGKLVFGYAFIKMNTLVFFTSNDAFKHLQNDLQSFQERE